jgi:hypothetical protein
MGKEPPTNTLRRSFRLGEPAETHLRTIAGRLGMSDTDAIRLALAHYAASIPPGPVLPTTRKRKPKNPR